MNMLQFRNISEISCATKPEITKNLSSQLKLTFLYMPVLTKFYYKQISCILKIFGVAHNLQCRLTTKFTGQKKKAKKQLKVET